MFLLVSKVCACLICSGGICPGGICPGSIYVLGGICPGGTCPEGSVQGVHVRVGYVPEPF